MYISDFGISKFLQKRTRINVQDATFHLQNLPDLKFDNNLPTGNLPGFPLGHETKTIYHKGHALPGAKHCTVFSSKQEKFIEEIFEDGRRNKRKAKTYDIVVKMRNSSEFPPSQWLNESQIKSLFAKISARIKKVKNH